MRGKLYKIENGGWAISYTEQISANVRQSKIVNLHPSAKIQDKMNNTEVEFNIVNQTVSCSKPCFEYCSTLSCAGLNYYAEIVEQKVDSIVEQVVDKFHMRSEFGVTKYKTTLKENNSDNYLLHLQEELMDATLYIEKKMDIEAHLTQLIGEITNDAELGAVVRETYRKK